MSVATTLPQAGSTVASENSADGPTVPLAPAARQTLAKWLAMVAKSDFLDLPYQRGSRDRWQPGEAWQDFHSVPQALGPARYVRGFAD